MRIDKFTSQSSLECIKIGDYIRTGSKSAKVSDIEKINYINETHDYFKFPGNMKALSVIR